MIFLTECVYEKVTLKQLPHKKPSVEICKNNELKAKLIEKD